MFYKKTFSTYEEHLSHWIEQCDILKNKVYNLEREVFKLSYPYKFKDDEIVGHYKVLYSDIIKGDVAKNMNSLAEFSIIYDVLNLKTGTTRKLKEIELIRYKESFEYKQGKYL